MTADEYMEKLDALMGRILGRLELVSDGPSANLASGTSADGDPNAGSPGKTKGSYDSKILQVTEADWSWEIAKLKRRYKKAVRIDSKRDVIKDGLKLIVRARYAPWRPIKSDVNTHRGNREWRRLIAKDVRTPTIIAEVFDISRPTIYKYRAEFAKNGKRAA